MKSTGLNKAQQQLAIKKIVGAGMTVAGWARTRGFSVDTVRNTLYRQDGRGEVGPVVGEIIAKLREEKLV